MSERSLAQAPVRAATPAQPVALQRACACGQHTHGESECAECKKKGQLQRKLAVGASNDPLEQEADRIADQVLAAPAHSVGGGTPLRIQRFAGQQVGQMDAAPARVDRVLASPGLPLEPEIRQDMEQRFGHDFSQVHIRPEILSAEADAPQAAAQPSFPAMNGSGFPLYGSIRTRMERAFDTNLSAVHIHEGSHVTQLGALAYAQGLDIHFAPGLYRPGTPASDTLLGHELVHVTQQRAGRVSVPQSSAAVVVDDPALEAEAEVLGSRAARGEAVGHHGLGNFSSGVIQPQRMPIQRDKKGSGTKVKEEPKKNTSVKEEPKKNTSLEDDLDAIAAYYKSIVFKQRDGVDEIKDAAKNSKEPSSMLTNVLAFAGEVALVAVSAGVGSLIAQSVERRVTKALAAKAAKDAGNVGVAAAEELGKTTGEATKKTTVNAAKLVADVMKDSAKDMAKKGAKAAITALADSGKTPLQAYFDGQRDFYTDQATGLEQEFIRKRKQVIRNAPEPETQATSMLEGMQEQYTTAKVIAKEETLKGWLSYLPKSNLGKEGGGWLDDEGEEVTTKHGEHSEIFTMIGEPKVKGLLYLFMDESARANIRRAQLAGADPGLRDPLKGKTLSELGIPFVMKGKHYEFSVNEKGIAGWDEIRTDFSWLSQFAKTERIGGNAVMQRAKEGAYELINMVRERPLPAVTD